MIKIILAVLCFVNVAIAQDVPTAGSYRDFSGGLNTYNASVALPANESPNEMNVVIDEAGALTQRNGFQSCGQIPSGATATNLYEYVKNDGSRNLIVTDNESIWQTADCVVYSTVTTGLSSLSMPRFTTALDKLWVVNGSTYPFTWDGSTLYRLDGLDNHPEAPKGKFITYWKSRVWIADTPTAPSSVYFSLLVDSLGNILSPETSTDAWTSTNQIYFNRDDGSPVYGMKAYRDNLYVFKETGISRLIFESEYSLSVAKNVSTIGSKFNESIVEMDDGLLRFVGRDGVYAFDGSTVKRLSTRWTPTFETIRQPSQSEQYKLWDSRVDWSKGNLNAVTLDIFGGGVVSLNYSSTTVLYDNFTDGNYSASPVWTFGNGTNNFNITFGLLTYEAVTNPVPGNTSGNVYTNTSLVSNRIYPFGITPIYMSAKYHYGYERSGTTGKDDTIYANSKYIFLSDASSITSTNGYAITLNAGKQTADGYIKLLKITNGAESTLAQSTCTTSMTSGTDTDGFGNTWTIYNSQISSTFTVSVSSYGISINSPVCKPITVSELVNSEKMIYRHAHSLTAWSCKSYTGFWANDFCGPKGEIFTNSRWDNIYISSGGYNSPGVFTSEITTATNVSVWKTFAADNTLNGQSLAYDIRTATSVYNTLLAPWRPITSGAVVSTTTDNYAQWRASLSTTDNGVTPVINSASIGWMTGGSSKSTMYGINYKSRYWLAASTSIANQYNDLVMVESKSPIGTHTRYNLPISAFAIWNGNLYGAIGNTPKIARLDYGSTDDGNAIMSWWDSRDEMYDNPILYKTINLGILDYANSPANTNIQIGLSPDMGENWEYKAFNMSNSTLPRNTKRLNYKANTSLGFRTRILNDTLGIGFKIYGIHNFGKITQFGGN